ncbi:MAG: integrase [Candidatus Bathyarchaeia archaeon]
MISVSTLGFNGNSNGDGCGSVVSTTCLDGNGAGFWSVFRGWLLNRGLRERYVRDLVCYARKFSWLLGDGVNLGVLEGLRDKNMVLSALSSLSRFLGRYKEWRLRLEDAGVRWNSTKSDVCFLNVYNGAESVSSFVSWMEKVKQKVEWNLWVAVCFCALTGLRTGEAVYSLNKIADGGLKAYPYNEELHVLEHFRDRWFLRKSKKAFVSVLTPRLEKILESEWRDFRLTYNAVRLRLKRRGLECRLYDARKFHNTVLWQNGVDEATINLLAGRLSTGIFQKHYWRPNIREVFMKVREILEPWEARFLS